MLVTNKINIDLVRGTPSALLMTHQGDVYTRAVEVSLFVDGAPWTVPDCNVAVRYLKPDGTGGMYNKLPDGTTACSKSDNKIIAKFAPQMFSVPGIVRAELQLYTQTEVLHTFAFDLLVQRAAASGEHSEDYFNLLPISMVGDLNNLDTDVKSSLVAAVNEVLRKSVRKINGKSPDGLGSVDLGSGDIKTPSGVSVTEAIEQTANAIPTDDEINAMILKVMGAYIKTVNGMPPDKAGNVAITSEDIAMSDGDYGWAGYNVTKAIDEVMSNIPTTQKINSLIDAKLAQLPFAEGVTFNG